MVHIEMRLNGRRITSASQLQRELTRTMEKHVEDSLRKAAGSGTRIRKTRDGYMLTGTSRQMERMKRRLR